MKKLVGVHITPNGDVAIYRDVEPMASDATLRDYFAAKAAQGFVSINEKWCVGDERSIALRAYRVADAMMKSRVEDSA